MTNACQRQHTRPDNSEIQDPDFWAEGGVRYEPPVFVHVSAGRADHEDRIL